MLVSLESDAWRDSPTRRPLPRVTSGVMLSDNQHLYAVHDGNTAGLIGRFELGDWISVDLHSYGLYSYGF